MRSESPATAPAGTAAPGVPTPPDIAISPPPAQWADLVRASFAKAATPRARRFREQLGLALDRPIIMTGHQASFWHAGILAKYLVCDAAASAIGASPAWVVVDQDEHEFTPVRAPTLDEAARRRVEALDFLRPADHPAAGLATASCPAFEPVAPAAVRPFAATSVATGLRSIVASLAAHASTPNAARQISGALSNLMAPLIAPASTIFATELASTDLFSELIGSIYANPRGVVDAYNRSIRAAPDAGLTPLAPGDEASGPELPLWRIRPGEPRRRVFARELAAIPPRELAPRALLLTGVLRLAGCDLFIHGTGGAVYDTATERWINDWLGESLSPKASVTATLVLQMDGAPVSSADVRRAAWFAHSARHNPALLGEANVGAAKRRLVSAIEVIRKHGGDPRPAFFEMHALLKGHATCHAAELTTADAEAKALERELSRGDPALDRTWPFPWHSQSALTALRDLVRSRFERMA